MELAHLLIKYIFCCAIHCAPFYALQAAHRHRIAIATQQPCLWMMWRRCYQPVPPLSCRRGPSRHLCMEWSKTRQSFCRNLYTSFTITCDSRDLLPHTWETSKLSNLIHYITCSNTHITHSMEGGKWVAFGVNGTVDLISWRDGSSSPAIHLWCIDNHG